MSCLECKPVVLGADQYPANTLQDQPLVLAQGCAQGKSGAIYCLKDDQNGTAHIVSSVNGQLSAPFAIGYNADIKAVADSSGYESVYVTTDLNDGVTYRVDSQLETAPLNNGAWRNISRTEITYDIDQMSDEGCNGTDWFFQDDSIIMMVWHGALWLDNYVITPELISNSADGKNFSVLADASGDVSRIKGMLECALNNSTSADEGMQLRSAFAMFETAEPTMYVSKGPYKFGYADIDMTVEGGDLRITSGRAGRQDQSITHLNISLAPNGLFNDKWFDINRLGAMFTYDSNCGKDSCGVPFVTLVDLDAEEKELYTGLLQEALKQDISGADRATIELVMGFINNPLPLPYWMNWNA